MINEFTWGHSQGTENSFFEISQENSSVYWQLYAPMVLKSLLRRIAAHTRLGLLWALWWEYN